MSTPKLTHAVAVVETSGHYVAIASGPDGKSKEWIMRTAVHPLPARDPLAEQRAAVVEAVRRMDQIVLSRNVLSALAELDAAERALAQPEPEPLRECPLCQSVNVKQMPTAGDDFCIVCSDCGLQTRRYPSFSKARAAWNARPERADARAAIEELVEAAEYWAKATTGKGNAEVLFSIDNGNAKYFRTMRDRENAARARFAAAKAAAEALVKGEG